MVCQACGTPVAEGVHFCPKCGAQVVAAPAGLCGLSACQPMMPMYMPRVQRHLQTLGILWCVFGAYRVVSGLIGMFFLRAFTMHNFGDDGWLFGGHWHGLIHRHVDGRVVAVIAVATVVAAALALVAGYSLLTRRPWGRMLAIIVAILALAQISVWHGARHLYAVGAGAGSFRAGV